MADPKRITVYVSIGNSDDKLPQVAWAAYAGSVQGTIRRAAQAIHGEWTSLPWSSFQNACWCFEIEPGSADHLKMLLTHLAQDYRQESIAWAVATTEFLSGVPADVTDSVRGDPKFCVLCRSAEHQPEVHDV